MWGWLSALFGGKKKKGNTKAMAFEILVDGIEPKELKCVDGPNGRFCITKTRVGHEPGDDTYFYIDRHIQFFFEIFEDPISDKKYKVSVNTVYSVICGGKPTTFPNQHGTRVRDNLIWLIENRSMDNPSVVTSKSEIKAVVDIQVRFV